MAKTYMRASNGEVFETSHPEYHKDCENLGSGQKGYAARQEYAREYLRSIIKPGDTVYYMVRSVSNSGMSRVISFYIIQESKGGRPVIRTIDSLMSDACGISESRKGQGLSIHGCGMDMGFHCIYILGRALFPHGFGTVGKNAKGIERRANSPRHAEQLIRAGYVFRGMNASGWDNDGGYALGYSSL